MERVKKLSVAYCKKILESSGKKYSDEETEKIRAIVENIQGHISHVDESNKEVLNNVHKSNEINESIGNEAEKINSILEENYENIISIEMSINEFLQFRQLAEQMRIFFDPTEEVFPLDF